MDEELRGILVGASGRLPRSRERKKARSRSTTRRKQVIDELKADDNKRWKELRDHFAEQGVMNYVNRVITQAKAADPAQRQPPRPRIHAAPRHLGRSSDPRRTAQIRPVPSRSQAPGETDQLLLEPAPQAREPRQDKRRLEEMKRFDPRFAKYAEDNPDLTLAEAKQLEANEPPKRGRKRGKK